VVSVAVTEGDKVAAQIQLDYEVNAYSLGDLITHVEAATEGQSMLSLRNMKRAMS
jgi:L-arabinose isomerase